MSLLAELDAFYTEHRLYGELAGSVEGDRVWMKCSCGAVLGRHIDKEGER